MNMFEKTVRELREAPRRWLVTGAAGFIGSNLVEFLLHNGQQVTGLDNFATGHQRNLEDVKSLVGPAAWGRFVFVEGTLEKVEDCRTAVADADVILHQGALGSVPRSIKDPIASHAANVTGTLQLLQAAREAEVGRFVFASSSSVYGDHPDLPKVESRIGRCLSPYAATKRMDEIYAEVFSGCYKMETVGLRYFNVFGPRQDPEGAYAAVIPKWIAALLDGHPIQINGDGETSRDFCHVINVIQANVLAACRPMAVGRHAVYNIAVGERTTLNQLYELIRSSLTGPSIRPSVQTAQPEYREFRAGDVRHSLADTSLAQSELGYQPTHDVRRGLSETIEWYVANHRARQSEMIGFKE